MLPIDLVHGRRQKDRLLVAPLGDREERALELASELVAIAEAHVGRTREELEAGWRAVDVPPRDVKLRDGLVALVERALDLDGREEIDAVALRAEVFTRAAARKRAEPAFERATVLSEIAAERGTSVEALEADLYADLRGAQVLKAPEHGALVPGGARAIVDRYDLAQAQSVLLRATRVTIELRGTSALALRALLRKLKFHRLLFTLARTDGGHVLVLDGPSALFEATTKYGLALALALPSVLACSPERIEAELRWGKERQPLRFVVEAGSPLLGPRGAIEAALADDVAALLPKLRAKSERFEVEVADVLLDVPGVGLVVPDLTVRETETGRVVHVEVLGYWSRDAVWRRVELAEKGLAEPVLFCASERLRVSEAVLPESSGASLYMFKGVMSATVILERVERLLAQAPPPKKQKRGRAVR